MYKRMFPSYTDAELESFLARHAVAEDDTRARIQTELEARKAGRSKHFETPQIPPLRASEA